MCVCMCVCVCVCVYLGTKPSLILSIRCEEVLLNFLRVFGLYQKHIT